jgi:aminotransferase
MQSLRIRPVLVALNEPDWSLNANALRAAVTPRTRAILLNTPGNPSGKIFTRAELEVVAALCIQHDLFLITDEIYEYFIYDGAEHVSPATLPGMRERTIVLSGFSKTFSITGWRLGYAVADARWMPTMAHFHDLTYVCPPAPLQHGAAAGLEQLPPSFYKQLATDHQKKRESLLSALRTAGMEASTPPGAYYILAKASRLKGNNAREKARNLLSVAGVAAVAGSAFFRPGRGEDLLRFCFAKQDAELDEACDRLRRL